MAWRDRHAILARGRWNEENQDFKVCREFGASLGFRRLPSPSPPPKQSRKPRKSQLMKSGHPCPKGEDNTEQGIVGRNLGAT